MEQREGYKKTKIGWIPEDWEVKRYKDVLREIDRQHLWDDNYEYNLISVRRRNGGCFFREKLMGYQIKTKTLRPIQENDFVISKMQVVHGATGVVPNSFDGMYVSASYITLNASPLLNIHYMNFWAQRPSFYRDVLISSHGVHIEKMTFKISSFMILMMPVPPLPEQTKIASILTTVDDKISSIQHQIQQTEQLKKGLMEKLLTEGIGHTEFKETKIGRIPKGWEVKLLKNVASIERGKFQHRPRNDPRFYGGVYPFVQTGDVGKSKGRLEEYSQTLNEEGLTKSKLFPRGTIIITIAANIGDTAIASFDVAFPDSLVGIIAGREMDVIFLEYYLRTQKNYLNKLATVNAQKNINLETLKPLSTPVPPIEEQKQIATILSTVDDKIEVLNQKKTHYQTLKKGLSQQLLTGQMRVKI